MKKKFAIFLFGFISMTVCAASAVMIPVMDRNPEIFSAEFLKIRGVGKTEFLKLMEEKEKKVPENRRKACMKAFRKHVGTFAPDWFEEFSGMDKALGLPADTYLAYLAYSTWQEPERHECTSWIVMPELTRDKRVLIHKNRDSSEKEHAPVFRRTPGKIGWIGSCSRASAFPAMGVNEKGLVVIMNNADLCDQWNTSGLSTPMIARILLENCSTPDEAAALLEKIGRDGAYSHGKTGSIFFFADAKKAGIVELAETRSIYVPFEFGYLIRANSWRLPGITALSKKTSKQLEGDAFREYLVRDGILEAIRKGGCGAEDFFSIARIRGGCLEEERFPVCWDHSNSFGTFEIDPEFPELTTLYLASGPPRNMIAVPIPVGAFALPVDMFSGKWTAMGFAFKQKAGMDHPKSAELSAVENKLCSEYRSVREQARILLRKGDRKGASGLLRNALSAQFARAEESFEKISQGK